MSTIIDTSVAVKWFSKEEGWEKADTILEKIQKGNLSVIVPSLFFYELGNVFLYKGESRDKIHSIKNSIQKLHITVASDELLHFENIYEAADKYNTTFYDAAYIALTIREQCEFITADKKLFAKVHRHLPHVKLL